MTARKEKSTSPTWPDVVYSRLGTTQPSLIRSGYAVAVFTEWRGQSFYLCVRYRTPEPAEEFVVRSTRLEYAGEKRLHLAYFRHTDRWQPVYLGLTVDGCFDAIEQEEIFWPLT